MNEPVQKGVIVIGAGGHAKVVIEMLRDMGHYIDYCVGGDDSPEICMNIPVLKGDERLKQLREEGYAYAFPAIGDNTIREKMALLTLGLGYELLNAISPSAKISPSAVLGKGIAVMAGAVVNAECRIGDFVIINTGATVDHDCVVRNSSHVAPQCALAGNIEIGEKVFLGIGVKVIPKIKIGDRAIIGAGSVVLNDLPSDITAVGTPAKIIKMKGNIE